MPNHARPALVSFGKKLAAIRKAVGYTQQQLADEIGVTRRIIAYYESESEHLPANLLVDLCRALNITSDALLGIEPLPTPKVGQRLNRRLLQIEALGPRGRRQVIQLLDSVIEAEQLKQQASAKG